MLLPGFRNFSLISTQVCLLLWKPKTLFKFSCLKSSESAVLILGVNDSNAICTTMKEHFDHITYLDYNYRFGLFVGLLSGLTTILTFYSRENIKGGYFDNIFFDFQFYRLWVFHQLSKMIWIRSLNTWSDKLQHFWNNKRVIQKNDSIFAPSETLLW